MVASGPQVNLAVSKQDNTHPLVQWQDKFIIEEQKVGLDIDLIQAACVRLASR